MTLAPAAAAHSCQGPAAATAADHPRQQPGAHALPGGHKQERHRCAGLNLRIQVGGMFERRLPAGEATQPVLCLSKRPPVHVLSQPRGMCKRPKTLCMKPVQHQSDDTKPCLAVLHCLRRRPTIMRGDPHPFMHVHVYATAPAAGLLAGPSGSGLTLVRWGRLSVPSSVPLVMPSTNANLQHRQLQQAS